MINDKGTSWRWVNNTIVVETPERPLKQKNVLKLKVPKIDVIHMGFVGLGNRGIRAVKRYVCIPGTKIVALCDFDKNNIEKCFNTLNSNSLFNVDSYYGEKGFEELCKRNDIDLVYVATDWLNHFPVAKCALENDKNVAVEVPAALTLKECWELVDLSEKHRKHCIMLENCCYDRFVMNTLNMVQNGVFGEIIKAQGAYIHYLSPNFISPKENGVADKLNWRLDYNMRHRGDVYATHGIGPIAQALNIHRGDRMKLLVAMDTKSFTGKYLVERKTGCICNYFRNGDHTVTLIRTELGKLIEIQHNVMTPQPYTRLYQLTGTKGFVNKYPVESYVFNKEQMINLGLNVDNVDECSILSENNCQVLVKRFEHPILKMYDKILEQVEENDRHNVLMDFRLVYCLQNGLPLDIDVYDLAEWCCLAELGELSMDNGSVPVKIPDFTRGDWNKIKGYSCEIVT